MRTLDYVAEGAGGGEGPAFVITLVRDGGGVGREAGEGC